MITDKLIHDTLENLRDADDEKGAMEVLRAAFHEAAAGEVLIDCHEFKPDRGEPRVTGFNSQGQAVMFPVRMPEVGRNFEHGGVIYHVKSAKNPDQKPADRANPPARKTG